MKAFSGETCPQQAAGTGGVGSPDREEVRVNGRR